MKSIDSILTEFSITRLDKHIEFDLNGIDQVTILLLGGNVLVQGCPFTTKIIVEIQWNDSVKNLFFPEVTLKNGVVTIKQRHFRAFIRQKNAYIIRVLMPQSLALKVRMFAGTVALDNLLGLCEVKLFCGDICVRQQQALRTKLLLGLGDIVIDSASNELVARTVIGDIAIFFRHYYFNNPAIALKTKLIGDIILKTALGLFDNPFFIQKGYIDNKANVSLAVSTSLGGVKLKVI